MDIGYNTYMAKNLAVINIDSEALLGLKSTYSHLLSDEPPQYALFSFETDGVKVTAYQEKKGLHKVVFQGIGAEKMASIWGKIIVKEENKAHIKPKYPQIGSDEVGTGTLFGPVCVCASYIEEKDLPRLKELGITDSKKLEDEKILELGPILTKEFLYSSLSLDNQKYNEVHQKGINMNAIKAKMHNRALSNLAKKHPEAEIEIDQFTPEASYYRYLKGDEIQKIDNFATKGESIFPSVALASCLARYSFLKKMEALDEAYGLHFPLGAGEDANRFLKKFIDEFGKDELYKVAKMNFKNLEEINEAQLTLF